jgi:hypothetical protein
VLPVSSIPLFSPPGRHGKYYKAQPEFDGGAYSHGRVSTMTITDSRSTLSAGVSERKGVPSIQPINSINAPDPILDRAKSPGIPPIINSWSINQKALLLGIQRTLKLWWVVGGLLAFMASHMVHAQEIKKLAEEVQNPVSDLVRVGFTNGTFFGAGANNHLFNVFNFETSTTRRFGDWALLNRLTIPIPYFPANAIEDKTGSMTGIGDIEYTGFIARDESKRRFKLIGGIGPTFILNTATDDRLGRGKWSVGPTLAIVSIPDPWVMGAIVRNLWSFAGDNQRHKVNQFVIQPFLNYNFSNGWYLTSTPAIAANWEAEDKRNRWTVPIGGGFGKVMFRGEKRPINMRLQGFYFLEKPDRTPDWTLQVQFQILFPDKPDKAE